MPFSTFQPDDPAPAHSALSAPPDDACFRRLIADVLDYAVILLDDQGRITSWNAGARHVFGWTAEEMLGQGDHRLFPEGDVQLGMPEAELALMREQAGDEDEGWRVRKDGSLLWANSVLVCLRDPTDGRFQGYAKIIRDITDRKKAEWLERDSRQVLEMVARDQPLDAVLLRVAELTERHSSGMRASILLLRDGQLACAAAPRIPHQFLELVSPRVLRLAVAMQGRGHEQGQSVVVTNVRTDPLWAEVADVAASLGIEACWSAPITTTGGSDILGMLLLYGRAGAVPTANDRQVIELAGRLIAITLEQRQRGERLAHRAQHDPLTGLANRAVFEDRLYMALSRAQRGTEHVAVCLIDLDRFKYVNDSFGHHAGDELLRAATDRWQPLKRDHDTLARLGGDEFALILPALENRADAVRVIQRYVNALRPAFRIDGNELHVTASMGIAIHPHDGTDATTLQSNADLAMYRVKAQGRDGFQCFEADMNRKAIQRLELEGQLRRATENGELELFFQPQADPKRRLIGLEALLRWRHPTLGMLAPAQFVAIAEETGQIVSIGHWVLREACRRNRAWQLAGLAPVRMAVNVSSVQFERDDFAALIADVLRETDLEPRWLELEITEGLLVHSGRDAIPKLQALREIGVSVTIDDFGTGYSSLSHLQRLPIDALKIDRSFVAAITPAALVAPNSPETAVIRATCSLAQSLGIHVAAVGVEAEHQREFLLRLGCRAMQGFLFGDPAPAPRAETYWQLLTASARAA